MNTVELNEQYIEFVFDNCDAIKVDMWAIQSCNFETCGEEWSWDASHKNFLKKIKCSSFEILLNLTNPLHFSHTHRLIFEPSKSIQEDGEDCIERLVKSDDICHCYINGICYAVPYELCATQSDIGIPLTYNNAQVNTQIVNSTGNKLLKITFKKYDR